MDIVAKFDGRPENFNVPGFNKRKFFPERFEMGTQEMIPIEPLEVQISFFHKIWPVVSSQVVAFSFRPAQNS